MKFDLAFDVRDAGSVNIQLTPRALTDKAQFYDEIQRALFGGPIPGLRIRLRKLSGGAGTADYACTMSRTIDEVTWAFRVSEDQLAPPHVEEEDCRVLQIRARTASGRSKLWAIVLNDCGSKAELYGFNEGRWSGPIFGSIYSEQQDQCTKDAFTAAFVQILLLLDLF